VLLGQIGGVSILLLGDAEIEQQGLVHAANPGLVADVVKVAHHGSAYQEPALLEAARPRLAVVSVGAGNDYGHPHPALLARLQRDGARVVRTDVAGAIAVSVAAGELRVSVR
jgi:competence protein ComEC